MVGARDQLRRDGDLGLTVDEHVRLGRNGAKAKTSDNAAWRARKRSKISSENDVVELRPVAGSMDPLFSPARDILPLTPSTARNSTSCSGFFTGSNSQEKLVDQAEDRGVGADAECEREHRYRGKSGIQAQQPRRVAHIAPEGVERRDRVGAEDAFSHDRDVAELAVRGKPRVVRRHPAGDVLVDLERKMRLDLEAALVVPSSAA